jgi:3-oxoadipate enol-lactonase
MPYAVTSDNVRLHYEEAGRGTRLLVRHEVAADGTTWAPQMRNFWGGPRCSA